MLINRINLIKPLYSRLPPGLCGLLTSCYCVSLKTFDFSDRKDYRLEKIAIIVLTLSAIDRVLKSPPIWNQVARLAMFLALFDLDGQESWERQLLY